MAAINSMQQAEILRKAKAGIALTNPNAASSALYSQYKTPAVKTTGSVGSSGGYGSVTDPNKKELLPGYTGAGAGTPIVLTGTGGYNFAQAAAKANPAAGGQVGAQNWIDDPRSGYGGVDKYAANAIDRYNRNEIGYDQLLKDSQRVGYTIPGQKVVNDTTTQPDQPAPTGGGGGYSGPSGSDLINSAYENNYAAQLQKLKAARDQSLAALAGQDNLIHQSAYDNRNSNDVVANQRLTALKEAMANQGLGASGDSVTGQLAVGTSQQQAANGINNNEGNQIQQLTAQRDAIKNNANADDLALMQQLQAARDTALVNQGNSDRGYGLDLAGLSGKLPGGGQTLAAQQFGWGQKMDTATQTGYLNGSRTLAGQNQDWQKATDERNFGYQKARDGIADKQYQQKFDQDVKQFGMSYALQQAQLNHQISNDAAQNAISAMNAQTSSMNAGTNADSLAWSRDPNNPDNKYKNWSMDPKNPDNKYKLWQMDPKNPNNLKAGPKPTTYDQAYKDIDSSPYVGSMNGYRTVMDQNGLGDYIFSLGLPQEDTKKLYARYKLKWGG